MYMIINLIVQYKNYDEDEKVQDIYKPFSQRSRWSIIILRWKTRTWQCKHGRSGVLMIQTSGDTRFMAYRKENHEPAVFTILNFDVGDLASVVNNLRKG